MLTMISVLTIFITFISQSKATVGGYNTVTDTDELSYISDLCNSVNSDIIDLVNSNGCIDCDETCSISVVSALRQVVAGTNYRVEINVCDDAQDFDIQFHVPLPVNGTQQLPQDLQIWTLTTSQSPTTTMNLRGGYRKVTDSEELSYVQDLCDEAKSDIIDLLNDNGCIDCDTNCSISVLSAQRQTVAGTNYKVDIAVCDDQQEFSIKFFVPLPENNVAQPPQDFTITTITSTDTPALTSSGGTYGGYNTVTDPEELAYISGMFNDVDSDIIDLVNSAGCINCDQTCSITLLSAQKQVVAGTNYKIQIAVCDDEQVFNIQFYVPLPENGISQQPQNFTIATIYTAPPMAMSTTRMITGGYSKVTDSDELSYVSDLCNQIQPDIIELVNVNGCIDCDTTCSISVISAQHQVVAGVNYRVNIAVCDDAQEFNIQFHVPLPVNGTQQLPQDLTIFTMSTYPTTTGVLAGGYNKVTDSDELSYILDLCIEIKSDIVELVNTDGCIDCDTTCSMAVLSAYRQVVAGTNYKVELALCDGQQVFDIQFFVPLPVNGTQQSPQDLQLISDETVYATTGNKVSGGITNDTEHANVAVIIAIVVVIASLAIAAVVLLVCCMRRRNKGAGDGYSGLLNNGDSMVESEIHQI